jgi:hypothetical protein
MAGDEAAVETRIVEEPSLEPDGVRLGLLVGDAAVTVWFHDRNSDGAARGGTTYAMRAAIKSAREYRRLNRDAFERLFEELEASRR